MGGRAARAAAVLGVLVSAGAEAGFFNARNLIAGDRAALLGGAFTAVADDGTAACYNPAGISELAQGSVSVSADAYALHALSRLGAFTNSSSAPQRYVEERVQMFGGSVGIVHEADGPETTVGLVAQAGGSGWQAETAQNPPVRWSRQQVSLVLGGSHKVGEAK